MGRRGSISEEQVFEAADALVAQGKEVTPTALLSSLGSGSFTTIYKHLSAWESSRASAVTDRAAVIPEAVLSAFGAAWRAATAEAGKEVLAVKEQAAEDVAAARTQFQEALQTIERLETESEADATRLESLSAKVAELEKSLHQSENERAALKATCEQLQHQVKSQESDLARVHKESESERKRHQEELAEARKDKDAAIKESAELRGKANTLEAQNKDLLTRLSERGDK
ncbi:MAG TPA: DNA-binding protein [Candidatus Melainabacteria bacterium]|jgi:chromosome segregation ATPase|nr:DNA-binding protein [Candidatus Melainabacteria bacterium]HIN63034.1 DNA-binding protein [Candidatus Obscuribacterales bacterium]